jgi:hypothetical protein
VEAEQPVEMRQSPPTADVNLADMAQRLEAALRRPSHSRDQTARPEPKARPAAEAPSAPAGPPTEPARPQWSVPAREAAQEGPRVAGQRAATPAATTPAAAVANPSPAHTPEPAKPAEATAETKPAPAKSVFDSLEEEMANLLGRSPGKP